MKQLIGHDIGGYTFDPTSGTIIFSGLPTFNEEQILTIVNVISNTMLYCFADPSAAGTLTGSTLQLNYNTTGMNASDPLQIYIDLPSTQIIDQAVMNDNYTHLLLERIADLLEPMATQDQQNRQRVSIDAFGATTLPTVTTVGTVTTVTNAVPVGNVATISGVDARYLFIDTSRNAYANCLRSKLTFS